MNQSMHSAQIRLFWDEARKKWLIRAESMGAACAAVAVSEVGIDRDVLARLVYAVREELESLLF